MIFIIFILFSYLISSLLLQWNGGTALISASLNGKLEVVRTLLEAKADVNAESEVRNQMMMMVVVVINDDDRDVFR